MSLDGKRALVTGASGALGAAIARRLATQGATVLLHASTHPAAVQTLADEITRSDGRAQTVLFDVTD